MAGRFLLLLPLLAGIVQGKDRTNDPELAKEVNLAIDKGVAWLLSRQQASGHFPSFEDARGEIYPLGMHALATLAVLKGSESHDRPEIQKALHALRSLYETNRNTLRTYEAGLTLMVLDAKYPGTDPKAKRKIEASDHEWAREIAKRLQVLQNLDGGWRYPSEGTDLSNTQYAALGLWAAWRLGVDIDRGVVRRMMELALRWQEPVGPEVIRYLLSPDPRYGKFQRAGKDHARGWRYMPDTEETVEGGPPRKVIWPWSGSMTTAGIALLAVGRDILGKGDTWLTPSMDRKVAQSVYDGLAWLAVNFNLLDNPGQPGNWPFYWLYGLERAARLCGVENVGEHVWYDEGAQRLVADQREDGSWPKQQRMRPPGDQNVRWWSDQVDTAFAILFLTRSTPQTKIPPPTITGGD